MAYSSFYIYLPETLRCDKIDGESKTKAFTPPVGENCSWIYDNRSFFEHSHASCDCAMLCVVNWVRKCWSSLRLFSASLSYHFYGEQESKAPNEFPSHCAREKEKKGKQRTWGEIVARKNALCFCARDSWLSFSSAGLVTTKDWTDGCVAAEAS